MKNHPPLILFAKAPVIGEVKTRLQPQCTLEQAAEIAKILLEQTIISARKVWLGEIILSSWLNEDDQFLKQMVNKYHLKRSFQCDGNLGDKMNNAFDRYGYPAAIMGCDIPHIEQHILIEAARLLKNNKNVIGPAEDGGYYLIGLNQRSDYLFTDINWGQQTVLESTIEKARENSLNFELLKTQQDIDTCFDISQVADKLPVLAQYIKEQKIELA